MHVTPILLLCSVTKPIPGDLSALISAITHWDPVLDAAGYHGVGPLLYRSLDQARPSAVPADIANRLADSCRDTARRGLFLATRLLDLLDKFEAEGLSTLPLKGPVLAEWLYPDPVLRPFSDLDILVRKTDVPAVLRLLNRESYALGRRLAGLNATTLATLHCEAIVQHDCGTQIDIHWDTAQRDYPFRFDPEILWRSRLRRVLDGQPVNNPNAESLLLFLCVHGAKHMWSRLMWLGDVARLVSEIADWNRALELAREAHCTRPVLLGLLLAFELLEAPVPKDILNTARQDQAVEAALRQVAARLDRIPPNEPSSMELTTFNVRLAEGLRAKARHYAARV